MELELNLNDSAINEALKNNIVIFFLKSKLQYKQKKFILEMFTSTEYDYFPNFKTDDIEVHYPNNIIFHNRLPGIDIVRPKLDTDMEFTVGDIFNISSDENRWIIVGVSEISETDTTFKLLRICKPYSETNGLVGLNDSLILTNDDFPNIRESKIDSTYGLAILNQLCLVEPFYDLIDYVNDEWPIGKIEGEIASLILEGKITAEMCAKYSDNGYFLGHSGEIAVPTFTRKSLTTDPHFKEKKDLLRQKYKDKTTDPVAMANYENELRQIDIDYLKDDDSLGFYKSIGASFVNHRKKMFLTFGLSEAFSNGEKTYNFVDASLSDGWQAKDIPVISNETRKASYGRGIETANGGARTKEIMKVFQNVRVVEEDCHDMVGTPLVLHDWLAKEFLNRDIIVNDTNGQKLVRLTKENISSYINKTVNIRSLMSCRTTEKNGYCYTCTGETIKTLGIESLGLQSVSVGSAFLGIAMKTMHNASVDLLDISDIDNYFIRSDYTNNQ